MWLETFARGITVKMLDYDVVVSDFERQLRYFVHFGMNTLGKDMTPSPPLSMGCIVTRGGDGTSATRARHDQ